MSTISENLEALKTAKTSIKSAIEGKGQDLTNVPFTQYGEKIEAIQTGLDVSDTTATESDVLEGKEFYNASGEKVAGTYKDKIQWICDNTKTLSSICSNGANIISADHLFQGVDTSEVLYWVDAFRNCPYLEALPLIDVSSAQTMDYMCAYCSRLSTVPPLNTSSVRQFLGTFSGCNNLVTIPYLDLLSATNVSNMFSNCKALTNLTLKNIKLSLQIGSGTSYGHKLTLDSLLNTIKELHTNTTTSTRKLTMGTANTAKLENVYVKLIDITDDMRAEDEYIDNKAPFVQCESTDEGAMLITEYVTTVKNWQLA